MQMPPSPHAEPPQAPPPPPGMMPGAMLSPDGLWRWDGTQWVPTGNPPPGYAPSGFQPLRAFAAAGQRANFAVMALGVAAVCRVIAIVADLGRIDVTNRLLNGTGATVDQATSSDNLVQLSNWLSIAALVLGAVAFLMWLHRVVANNHALRVRRLEYTPGWAVGWWFVPIMNLVRPYQVVAETWHATDPQPAAPGLAAKGDAPPLVLGWWLVYLAGGIVGAVAGGMSGNGASLQSLHDGAVVAVVGHLLEIVAAGLGAVLVVRITGRQEALRAATQQVPATVSA